jgi:aminopeptidase N
MAEIEASGATYGGDLEEENRRLREENEQLRAFITDRLNTDALAYLRMVYSDPMIERRERMRAAEAALPYEKPKLAATVVAGISGEGFAEMLEAKRLQFLKKPD